MNVVGRKIVKTRVEHICFGCGRKFCKGAVMECSCVFDGTPWTCYLCKSCQEASAELNWQNEYGFGDLRDRALEIENTKMGRGVDHGAQRETNTLYK